MQNSIAIKLYSKRKSSCGTLLVIKKENGIFLNNISISVEEFAKSYSLENFIAILKEVSTFNKFSFFVYGGGVSSQKDAIKYLMLKYITILLPDLKSELKKSKVLYNDTRIKERKIYGHLKSRKKKQYSKR